MQDNWMENNSLWLKGQLLVKNHLESEYHDTRIFICGKQQSWSENHKELEIHFPPKLIGKQIIITIFFLNQRPFRIYHILPVEESDK